MTLFLLQTAATLIFSISIGFLVRRSGRRVPAYGLILGLLLAACGIMLCYYSSVTLTTAASKESWPIVKGVVERVHIDREGAPRPKMVYSYRVDSVRVVDSSDWHQPSAGSSSARQNVAGERPASFNEGDTVNVYVNPDDRQDNTLDPEPHLALYVQVGFSDLVLASGLVLALNAGRRRKEPTV